MRFPASSKKLRIKPEVVSAFAGQWISTQSLTPSPLLAEFVAQMESAICRAFGGRYELSSGLAAVIMEENGIERFTARTGRHRWPYVRRVTPS